MPARAFGLGESIIRALGLEDSMLPQALLDHMEEALDRDFQITVGADSTQIPCMLSESDRSGTGEKQFGAEKEAAPLKSPEWEHLKEGLGRFPHEQAVRMSPRN